MKSIIQDRLYDYLGYDDGTEWDRRYLEEHHIFFGHPWRDLSEKYGLKVYLTTEHHKGNDGPHLNREVDLRLKREAQEITMEHYGWTTEQFIDIFGRNYL